MTIVLILVGLLLALLLLSAIIGFLFKVFIFFLIVLLCGFIAQAIVKYRGGLEFTLVSALIGGVVGLVLQWLLPGGRLLTISGVPVVWTILGSVIVIFIAKLTASGGKGRTSRGILG